MSTATFVHARGRSMAASAPFLLALLAFSANAAPLGCQVNQTDGVSLKAGQTMIENTTDKVIAQDTVIETSVQVARGIGKARFVTSRVAAPSTLQVHDRMSAGDTPTNARSCTARIALVQPHDTVTNKQAPVIAK
jgi:hypothetical protein